MERQSETCLSAEVKKKEDYRPEISLVYIEYLEDRVVHNLVRVAALSHSKAHLPASYFRGTSFLFLTYRARVCLDFDLRAVFLDLFFKAISNDE